jgi:transposase-like protein
MIDINNLTDEQKQQLIIALQASLKASKQPTNDLSNDIREARFNKGFVCPHCGATKIVRHGTYKGGKQRYLCRNCNSTFSDLTNTPLSRAKLPEKWTPFIECMLKGYSLRKTSEIIGVSHVSLFYWRHKLLAALTESENMPFEGIVEMDETYFLYSEKGKKNLKNRKARKRGGGASSGITNERVCVFVARDRVKHTFSKVSGLGRIKMDTVDKFVGNLLSSDNTLCTDGWKPYKKYAHERGMECFGFAAVRVYKGIYHIQNVNNYHMRLKKWMDRFNGVASKYLNNYLAWFKFIDSKAFENTTGILVESCLHNSHETNESLRIRSFEVA